MKRETTQEDLELVRRVCQGEPHARRMFLERVTEVVRARVARVLARVAGSRGTVRRQDLLDLMQDVFVVLLDRDARVLLAWAPTRGLGLEGYVGLIAEREALTFRRVGRRSAWAENPTEDIADGHDENPSPEATAEAKEQLELLLDYLFERLSPHAALVFEALYASNLPLEEICERFRMSPEAVYSFKTRLKRLVAHFRESVERPRGERAPLALYTTLESAK